MKHYLRFILLSCCLAPQAWALRYALPPAGQDSVGKIQFHQVSSYDSFGALARHYDIGYDALRLANPGVDPDRLIVGTVLVLPQQHLLPAIRKGIVINLPEKQLYYFPPKSNVVYTFPVGIGRKDWDTPTGLMKITERRKNPIWTPPENIRQALKQQGKILPRHVMPGPDNPLGHFALRLSYSAFLIHGSNDPIGVGQQISAGCLRMYNRDIETLYHLVKLGTPVSIVNEPLILGQNQDKQWFLASYPPIQVGEQQTHKVIPTAWLDAALEPFTPSSVKTIMDNDLGIPLPLVPTEDQED